MTNMMQSGGGQSSGTAPIQAQEPLDPTKRAAQGFAIAASTGAGFSAFWGLRDFFSADSGIVGWLLPVSLALVVVLLVGFCWHMILEEAHE